MKHFVARFVSALFFTVRGIETQVPFDGQIVEGDNTT
jgi:hypothetical protein